MPSLFHLVIPKQGGCMEGKMEQSITRNHDDFSEEIFLKEYSQEEQEENKIAKVNSKAVFSPEFIPYYPAVQEKYSLTNIETLIYGFLRFYTSNNRGRFYFTNEQIAKIVSCSEKTVVRSMKTIRDKKLFEMGYKIRSGGGTIRFVKTGGQNVPVRLAQNVPVSLVQNVPTNKNKINKNKIKEYISLFNSLFNSSFRETKGRMVKLEARLRTYEFEDILKALTNLSKSKFHQGENDRSWKADPDFLIRSDEQIDKWLNTATETKQEKPKVFINLKGNYEK